MIASVIYPAGAESPAKPCRRPVSCRRASSARAAHIRGERMPTGTVKWFNNQKGFGFITPRMARRTSSFTRARSSARAIAV